METLTTERFLETVKFDAAGLVPVIAQQYDSGDVLMLAYMNKESLKETLQTKRMCYYSRSRQTFWRKGDTSGHVQTLKSMRIDCDGDTLLALIDQTGAACHTNNRTCFYREEEHAEI